ncbi:helix-turn-helix domain-containing protein [Nonomuraea africana]|uniref:helix-turn-helix domain-containing protein n=1 Tax=Nonomuraea africana TaxID=46171 RepID=UPI003F4D6643
MLRPHLDDGVPLVRVASHAGRPYRTLQRRLADYRRDGLAGLARRPRRDAGTRRLPRELQLLIEGLALQRPAPSIATIHRQVATVASEQRWPVPSYATVYAIICGLDPAMTEPAQQGRVATRSCTSWCTGARPSDPTRSGWPATPSSTCG